MRPLTLVLLYSLAWAGFGLVSGWAVTRIPDARLDRSVGLLRLRRWEHRGRRYDRVLKVRRWKDRLPDAGALFGRGVRKADALGFDTASLRGFAVETRRAELVHWANAAFGLSFWLWAPANVAVAMTAFGVVVHAPFVVVQRYNRAKAEWILEHRGALTGHPADSPRPVRRIARASAAGLAIALVVAGVAAVRRPPTREVTVAEAVQRLDGARLNGSAASLVPAEGVYRYTGSGTERLASFEPTAQGPTLPATVEHTGDGCWAFRIDYNSRHWQRYDFCAVGGRLVERGGASEQRFDLVALEVTASTTTACPGDTVAADPQARVGDVAEVACEVRSSGSPAPLTSSGPSTFVGRTDLVVGGAEREALHYRRERTFSGDQTGTEQVDLWFDARSGLPLRGERRTTLTTDSPIGSLTYTEDGAFRLAEADPS